MVNIMGLFRWLTSNRSAGPPSDRQPAPRPDDGFLAAIRQDPDDDTPRLVYADWLEERGDPRAEFLRVECEVRKLPSGDERFSSLWARFYALLRALDPDWVALVRRAPGNLDFHIGAVIRDTNEGDLLRALSGGRWIVRPTNGNTDMLLKGEGLDYSIYPDFDRGEHGDYLVSGRAEGTREQVLASVSAVADRLAAHGLVYEFDVSQEDDRDNYHEIVHPAFRSGGG